MSLISCLPGQSFPALSIIGPKPASLELNVESLVAAGLGYIWCWRSMLLVRLGGGLHMEVYVRVELSWRLVQPFMN